MIQAPISAPAGMIQAPISAPAGMIQAPISAPAGMIQAPISAPAAHLLILLCLFCVSVAPHMLSGLSCRNALVQAESRTLEAELLTRHCIIMRLADFSTDRWYQALSQSAGALLILVPETLSGAPQGQQQGFLEGEMEMLRNDTWVPIYFAVEQEELLSVYEESKSVSQVLSSSSALQVMLGLVMGNGFQMVTGETQSQPISNSAIVTMEGQLRGRGEPEELPTVVIVAHYDSAGAAPWLAFGADSNGSGVAVLLEIMRLFHRLYRDPYNLLFSLTGAGKFSYYGSKRWIEEHLDHLESSPLHENVAFVLCLDTLANGDTLHIHASRPPQEGTAQWDFIRDLESVIKLPQFQGVDVSLIHKKINLGEDILAWEHEQFSLRRIPAFTVSHLSSHQLGLKSSILDTRSQVDTEKLRRNTHVLLEALARFLYKEPMKFPSQEVDGSRLTATLDWLVAQPRAAQLLGEKHPLLITMETLFRRYLRDTKRHVFRDPEFVFYDQLKQTMTSHRGLLCPHTGTVPCCQLSGCKGPIVPPYWHRALLPTVGL
uniref:BOS complex subunit NCLN n=1 Tax=Xenopus tropicalis TaxID=8364 RepID=A0A803JQT7_XENTR